MNTPLVTVGVVTYNSSEFIEETLDSIYNQDYQNIELIVSDDCSTDNTVEICMDWINKKGSRFVRCKIVTTDKNTGVSGNSNRALNEARGEWYKCFDGDDVLLPDAISSYLGFIEQNPDCTHVAAKIASFDEEEPTSDYSLVRYMTRPSVTARKQYEVMSKTLYVECPTYFAETQLIREVGGFDEAFPMQEDHPLLIRMMYAGNRMGFLDKETVKYRVRTTSISHTINTNSIFPKNRIRMYLEYKMRYREYGCTFIWKCLNRLSVLMCSWVIKSGNNRRTIMCNVFYAIHRLFDPYNWYNRYIQTLAKKYERRYYVI